MHSALAVVDKKSRKKFQDLAAANYETNWKLAADTNSKMQKMAGGKTENTLEMNLAAAYIFQN